MEIFWIILGALFIMSGFIGAFLPILPGLPLSYIGLIILQLLYHPFSWLFMGTWLAVVLILGFILDNILPAWLTKKSGGSPYAITGSIIGLVGGLFFPPIGLVAGPLIGAFLGEMIAGSSSKRALRSALGAFAGFMASTGLKVMAAGIMAWFYFSRIAW